MLGSINAKPIHADGGEPVGAHLFHLGSDSGIVVIQIRHTIPKVGIVITVLALIPMIPLTRFRPDVPITIGCVGVGGGVYKPGMLRRCMVQDQVDDDADAFLMGL